MCDTGEHFHTAVRAGDAETVRRLVSVNPELAVQCDEKGATPALLAVYYGHPQLVSVLQELGVNLTLWEAAAVGDRLGVEAKLTEDPASIRRFTADGWTPLHLAVFFGHLDVADVLLSSGADTSLVSRNPMDVTPLQSALARCNEECAGLLVEYGADVSGGASKGWPPIAYAGANELYAAANLLLDRGANVNARTPDGKTALALAQEKGHAALVELLTARGGTL